MGGGPSNTQETPSLFLLEKGNTIYTFCLKKQNATNYLGDNVLI